MRVSWCLAERHDAGHTALRLGEIAIGSDQACARVRYRARNAYEDRLDHWAVGATGTVSSHIPREEVGMLEDHCLRTHGHEAFPAFLRDGIAHMKIPRLLFTAATTPIARTVVHST